MSWTLDRLVRQPWPCALATTWFLLMQTFFPSIYQWDAHCMPLPPQHFALRDALVVGAEKYPESPVFKNLEFEQYTSLPKGLKDGLFQSISLALTRGDDPVGCIAKEVDDYVRYSFLLDKIIEACQGVAPTLVGGYPTTTQK